MSGRRSFQDPNPCLACGACCASFRVSFYWREADDMDAEAVPVEMTRRVAPLLCAMAGTDQPHPRCIALEGIVGCQVRCAIYPRRPSVCREFAPSGQGAMANALCDRARDLWGLPPPWQPLASVGDDGASGCERLAITTRFKGTSLSRRRDKAGSRFKPARGHKRTASTVWGGHRHHRRNPA